MWVLQYMYWQNIQSDSLDDNFYVNRKINDAATKLARKAKFLENKEIFHHLPSQKSYTALKFIVKSQESLTNVAYTFTIKNTKQIMFLFFSVFFCKATILLIWEHFSLSACITFDGSFGCLTTLLWWTKNIALWV